MSQDGVHQSHCCKLHGCKYGDEDCPVEQGRMTQDGPCETCGVYDNIHTIEELNERIQVGETKIAEKLEAIRIGLDGVNEAIHLQEYDDGDKKHKKLKRMKLYLKHLSKQVKSEHDD